MTNLILAPMRGYTDVVFRNVYQRYFSGICEAVAPFVTSIKGRRIKPSHLKLSHLVSVFNRYPLSRVIVHPRTGIQMYDGTVDMAAFQFCLDGIHHPVIYNGDITHLDTFKQLSSRFPTVAGYMLGRGLIANPFLPEMIQTRGEPIQQKKQRFMVFHEDLVDEYSQRFYSQTHVLDRMKGFWRYIAMGFDDKRRILKRIRKADTLHRYRREVADILEKENGWGGNHPMFRAAEKIS